MHNFVSFQMFPCAKNLPAFITRVTFSLVYLVDVVLQAGLGRVRLVAMLTLVPGFALREKVV